MQGGPRTARNLGHPGKSADRLTFGEVHFHAARQIDQIEIVRLRDLGTRVVHKKCDSAIRLANARLDLSATRYTRGESEIPASPMKAGV